MQFPYMTFEDNTEVTHSAIRPDHTVDVYIETPVPGGFHHATCKLPEYRWLEVTGYSDEEMKHWDEYVRSNAHLILGSRELKA